MEEESRARGSEGRDEGKKEQGERGAKGRERKGMSERATKEARSGADGQQRVSEGLGGMPEKRRKEGGKKGVMHRHWCTPPHSPLLLVLSSSCPSPSPVPHTLTLLVAGAVSPSPAPSLSPFLLPPPLALCSTLRLGRPSIRQDMGTYTHTCTRSSIRAPRLSACRLPSPSQGLLLIKRRKREAITGQ